MNYLKHYPGGYGLKNVVSFGEAGLKKSAFDILKLKANERYEGNTGEFESAFVILSGTCSIAGDGFATKILAGKMFFGQANGSVPPCHSGYEVVAVTNME